MTDTTFPLVDSRGYPRTSWAVICFENAIGEEGCGRFYLTAKEYDLALRRPNQTWRCPHCGVESDWDDDNHADFSKRTKK